jgi:hypothetical protein
VIGSSHLKAKAIQIRLVGRRPIGAGQTRVVFQVLKGGCVLDQNEPIEVHSTSQKRDSPKIKEHHRIAFDHERIDIHFIFSDYPKG